jgi:hypothetical protein
LTILWKERGDAVTEDSGKSGRRDRIGDSVRRILKESEKSGFFILTVLIAWVIELVYGLSISNQKDGFRIFAILWFGSGASFFIGTIFGFLFGIPKSRRRATPPEERYDDNTSLEEISDWLTKLIIGAGLVEIERIVAFVAACGVALGRAIDPNDQFGGAAVATGSLVVAFATGFLHYYMWARIIVAKTLRERNAVLHKA